MLPHDKEDQLYLVSERRPNRLEREQWLQRRNSMSSQRAIFPHNVYSHPFEHRPRYTMYNYAPSSRYSRTLRSVSEGASSDLSSDRSSSLNSTPSSGSFARSGRTSTTFHSTRSRATSIPEKLITVRPDKDSIPDVPPLPAPPAPTWSPALHHTPLSADPSIRALTSEGQGEQRLSLAYSRSSPALLAQLPPQHRPVEAAALARGQESTDEASAVKVKTTCAAAEPSPESATASARPSIPPPGPPPTSNLPLIPTPATVSSIPPAIPLRAQGHSHSSSRTATPHDTSSSSPPSSLRPALRRPSPLRSYHYTPQQHYQKYQSEMVLQAGMGGPATLLPQHSRTYRRQDRRRGRDPVSSSIYSTSSYGTSRTMASSANAMAVAR